VHTLIWPDIFDGRVRAFFTRKWIGADRTTIGTLFSMDQDMICMPLQRHTDIVWLLNEGRLPVTADAVVTRKPGILIGVQVADCVPMLLHDRSKSIVGAVHAGWRGTSLQILKKTISLMSEHFGSDPRDMKVAFGPSIKGHCYQVDSEVNDAVMSATGPGDYAVRKNDKFCVDLASANMIQALSSGIPSQNIWISPECTYCNPDDYHSYRYHGNHAGRQGGFIGIF
jgi:polyphenol oxidase